MAIKDKVSKARERQVNLSGVQADAEVQKILSETSEDFLPADGGKGEDKVEKSVQEKKKKKKCIRFMRGSKE
eukprot:CAMPEP_0194102060 /NCGR_PEP_ID=MMETSP0150-20130528/2726_1 /TAXON_ID=122233 /ORGANISM="Chaetoceros debilis, Strain MM31A-1" /LENGTH=71 /DNA_ID=CAMNT_0038788903 /DNA_START=77 /DNA_END=292 /DNA_ORIENTATION=+